MRPLRLHGRLPRSVIGLPNILIIPTSAFLAPKYRLSGVLQRLLGSLGLRSQVRKVATGAPVPGALGLALCRARRAEVAAVVRYRPREAQVAALCGARGGQLVGAPVPEALRVVLC